MKKVFLFIIAVVFVFTGFESCSDLKNLSKMLTDIQAVKFKLDGVTDYSLMGIKIGDKSSISSFSAGDALKLGAGVMNKSMPATFTVNVAAYNPNSGSGGTKKTDCTITSLKWRLLIDEVQTISGVVSSPVTVPSAGTQVIIPLQMNLDLYKFFASKSYESIANLALGIGGAKKDLTRLKIVATPSVKTSFGEIAYPGEITIINKEYR